jgi:hypothetical protein
MVAISGYGTLCAFKAQLSRYRVSRAQPSDPSTNKGLEIRTRHFSSAQSVHGPGAPNATMARMRTGLLGPFAASQSSELWQAPLLT